MADKRQRTAHRFMLLILVVEVLYLTVCGVDLKITAGLEIITSGLFRMWMGTGAFW